MKSWGHRGVALTLISCGGIILLGADLIQPALYPTLSLFLCLGLGTATATLPNTLERLSNSERRGLLHSVFAPVIATPTIYLLIVGSGTQLQQAVSKTIWGPATWSVFAALIAGTIGGIWLVHIIVDSGAHGRGRLSLRPFSPVSDRIVSAGIYQGDSQTVNVCSFIVGVIMAALLTSILAIQVVLGIV